MRFLKENKNRLPTVSQASFESYLLLEIDLNSIIIWGGFFVFLEVKAIADFKLQPSIAKNKKSIKIF